MIHLPSSTYARCLAGAWALLGVLLCFGSLAAYGQAGGAYEPERAAQLLPVASIQRNEVAVMEARGDSLWIGPYLNLTTDGGQTWQAPASDSLGPASPNRIFSLDVEGAAVWAGLGYTGFGGEPAAAGLLVSSDGGATFAYRRPPLDAIDATVLPYGVSTLRALPVTAPEGSPPYDVAYDARTGTAWLAGWASGLRRSTDGGRSWQRVVLPPDSLPAIRPDEPYDFVVAPQRGTRGFRNYLAFSVLVDETGAVWAGTRAGVNRSRPADVFPQFEGARAWRRFGYAEEGTGAGLTGDWVVALAEQPRADGRNPIWMATWAAADPAERFGVTVTRDGGQTFEQVLLDELIYDFAFRGATVYAAGQNGLFISEDGGRSWTNMQDFAGAQRLEALTVATTRAALWVGTADGLLKSTDGGETWEVFRAEVPLDPEEPTEEVPRVDTYAYPNPFSPAAAPSGRVRIVVEGGAERTVDVQIFDFGMNLVRRLDGTCAPGARCEIAWDGTGEGGRRVANGVYFYTADVGDRTVRGKIMVLE